MRGRSSERSQNFDSLLDMMANVVGILVVVMALTQLQIGEAVRRIHDTTTPDATRTRTTLERAGQGAEREIERLLAAFTAREATTTVAQGKLEALTTQLEAIRGEPTSLEGSPEDLVASLLRETRRTQASETERDALLAAKEQLTVRLQGAEEQAVDASHPIRLPDPRPAPYGADEMIFFCRYGRIVPVELEKLNDALNRGLRAAGAPSLGAGFGGSVAVGHFERYEIGNDLFRWRLSDRAGVGVAARLEFRNEEAGELRSELAAPGSLFRSALATATPNSHYLRFFVWSDSFATYLSARQIAEERGFSVGWEAYDLGAEHEGILKPNVPRSAIPID